MKILGILLFVGCIVLFIREMIIDEKEKEGISHYQESHLKPNAKIISIKRIKTFKKEIRTQVVFSDDFTFTTTSTKTKMGGMVSYVDNEMRLEIANMAIEAHEKALKRKNGELEVDSEVDSKESAMIIIAVAIFMTIGVVIALIIALGS